jgi:choline dehydrogenase-like flavoprotein
MPNLFVADGSVLPTQGAANPALAIMALSDRLARLLGDKRLGPVERRRPLSAAR